MVTILVFLAMFWLLREKPKPEPLAPLVQHREPRQSDDYNRENRFNFALNPAESKAAQSPGLTFDTAIDLIDACILEMQAELRNAASSSPRYWQIEGAINACTTILAQLKDMKKKI